MRHFLVALILATLIPLPILGAAIVILLGYGYEYYTHDYSIPDDEDTRNDLANDILGAVIGNVLNFIALCLII